MSNINPLEEIDPAEERQRERRDHYAAIAGERLREATDCQFSLLPYDGLAQTAAGWYEACAQAMLKGNYSSIEVWIKQNAKIAAEEGFELKDLVQLLRICRQVAIEREGWNEDLFSDVDVVIDDGLASLRSKVAWDIPAGLNYVTGKSTADEEREATELAAQLAAAKAAEPVGERRTHQRNKLKLPIRVRGVLSGGPVDEITRTENVARGGVYFLSGYPYFKGGRVSVMYPYWSTPGAINHEYPGEVVRIDTRETALGVAVKFMVSLGSPGKSPT